jgi:drug/metabolite transporter (DMT)-like permease
MSNKLKAHIALLVSGLIFGANYWIAKEIMPEPLLPRQIIFIRVFSAAVLFWALSLTIKKETVSGKHLIIIALSSTLGVAINQIFFFEGLNLTTPVDAAILHAGSPIMVLIFAAWVIREKVFMINMLGVFFGAAGALLLIFSGKDVEVFRGDILGNIFILINLVAYALYLVLIKPIMKTYHPLTVMKWVFVFGLIAVTPFTFHTIIDFELQVLTGNTLFSLLYIVIGTTVIAYILTIYGLKYLKASSVGYYIYLQPLMAGVIGLIWYTETVSWVKAIAAVLIFAGVYFVNLKRKV